MAGFSALNRDPLWQGTADQGSAPGALRPQRDGDGQDPHRDPGAVPEGSGVSLWVRGDRAGPFPPPAPARTVTVTVIVTVTVTATAAPPPHLRTEPARGNGPAPSPPQPRLSPARRPHRAPSPVPRHLHVRVRSPSISGRPPSPVPLHPRRAGPVPPAAARSGVPPWQRWGRGFPAPQCGTWAGPGWRPRARDAPGREGQGMCSRLRCGDVPPGINHPALAALA